MNSFTFKSDKGILLQLIAVFLMALSPAMAHAIEYEGFLIDPNGSPLSGSFDITFTLYEGNASSKVWVEKQSGVKVKNGTFHVDLGSKTPFESASIRWEKLHFLGIRAGNAEEQKPREIFRKKPIRSARVSDTRPSSTKTTSAPASTSTNTPINTHIPVAIHTSAANISIDHTPSATNDASNQALQQHIKNNHNPHQITAAKIGASTQKDIYAHAQKPSVHHQKTTKFSELKDTISNKQIAANSITGKQIRNASIKAEDIADHTITAKKIKGGKGSKLDADLLDGMQAKAIIAAAQSEVRTPIKALPFTISKSGSYFLTADLKVSKQHGIDVKSNNVTIDLMGFSITGDGSKANGISLDGTSNVTVQNGTIREFGAAGIFTSSGDGHRIIQIRVINNGSGGIFAFSSGTLIDECMAWGNSSVGIATGANAIIRSSISRSNHGNGISAENGSTMIGNTVYANKGEYGISATGSSIKDNSVYDNAGTGIFAGTTTLIGNTISNNSGWGIQASDGSTVLFNTVSLNNKADTPGKGGISVGNDCQIKGNTVTSNKQNNIHVLGSDNMIEENLITDSLKGKGINFAHPANGPQNFYANNRASGNGKDYAGNLPTGSADGGGNASF